MKVSDFRVNDFYVHDPRPEDMDRSLVLELKQGNGADVYAILNPKMAERIAHTILQRLGKEAAK